MIIIEMKEDRFVSIENTRISAELTKQNIKPSHQRIEILIYLISNRNHPTADRIYVDLKTGMPTLSKSTVYNTLKAFVNAGLIHEITIDDNETRFEYQEKSHGHFKCGDCSRIYDFDIDIERFPQTGLDDFQIDDKGVYFTGICKDCLKNKNKIEGG
jgi:Fur family transcriptional regulator, peroxide stress response regulator